jgi:release factor glutamine methyltransferase
VTWRLLYLEALERLSDRQAAQWFVEEASGGAWPAVLDEPALARAEGVFRKMLDRRQEGEPVQYVLGHWAFRHLDLMVDRRVLIPRPETEVVVEVALRELARLAGPPLVVDLGTGSGAIALSIATECAGAEVWATDLSEDALAVASANLAGLGTKAAGRARLVHGSWWHALPAGLKGTLDLAVTNPPYVAENELASLPGEVSGWEPLQALIAGPSGLEALKAITAEAPAWLGARSAFVAEIAPHQDRAAVHLAYSAGFEEAFVKPDLTGRPRVLVARRGS